MELYLMQPSQLGNVLGACDPAGICDRNWTLINDHFGLSLPSTNTDDIDSTTAPGVLQANFAAIVSAVGVTLRNVVSEPVPEVVIQANFEAINGAW